MEPKMTIAEMNAFLEAEFPQIDGDFRIDQITDDGCDVTLIVAERHLRPGNTVSGPAMFALADVGMYIAVMSRIGPVGLAVTTNCSIDFMRKPVAGVNLIGKARLHKLGRVLAVGDVLIYSEGMDAPVARASLTYSIPKH
ncbi:PaaI family thioesterase [Yoonia sp. 208BN28-4]|uniref:PaaI family thioesterase n=1 Tax=Yoonia sp. 208BN28-4 TaxID=3126505 RepID=UPI00309BE9CD